MKPRWMTLFLCMAATVSHAAPGPVDTAMIHPDGSDYDFYRCDIDLGGDIFWDVAGVSGTGAERLYLVMPFGEAVLPQGRRMRSVMRERNIQRGQSSVSQLTWLCREYALKHAGRGPASLDKIDDERLKSRIAQVIRSPWTGLQGIDVAPPYSFLLPDVQFAFSGPRTNRVQRKDRKLLAVELTPFVDDGKHWVSYTDGSSERVDIDAAVVKQYALEIRPVMSSAAADSPGTSGKSHTLVAVRKTGNGEPLVVTLTNTLSGEIRAVPWAISDAPVSSDVTNDLQRARAFAWMPYAARSSGLVIDSWVGHDRASPEMRGRRGRRRGGETTSAFALLGGRAAVRETLQMQSLRGAAAEAADRTIAITNLQGVSVKSHPYEDMLGGQAGGRLELADVVPTDQFLLYVAKPAAILPLLDDGADFLSQLGSVVAANSIKYDLPKRYLARLGMNKTWLQNLLKSGAVQEMAILTPDLFFIDGTDVSVVSRLAQPALIEGLLKLIGVTGISGDEIVERRTKGGPSVFWSMRGDLLFVSTDRQTVDAMLALRAASGAGSMGRSAEFRYMLTQLPVTADTRIYAYLSDAFVRRLVGPQVKLAQLRRVTARSEMEVITAAALLARLDGLRAPSVEKLISEKYIPERLGDRGYRVAEDLAVHSAEHGTLAGMATFAELPVNMVSTQEAQLYKAYVENYSRFWRQFFDPIAIRLDDTEDHSLELTTFILPLIDNSIYNQLREILHTREDNRPLKTPIISPPPLLKLSLNLKESAWIEISKGFYELFERYAHINPAVLDDLGPGFHLAIHDADPVIALGSGEFFGAFGGSMSMRNSEMFMIPLALTVLTRPCTMAIETQDPAKTTRYLREAASTTAYSRRRSGWFGVDLHEINGRDEWIFTLDLENIIKLRYGMQVDGSYVLVRNIPWSSLDRIEKVEESTLNAARVDAHPGACVMQLAGLHAAAADGARASAADSMGQIYPLLLSGVATAGNVEQVHQGLFGFYPVHPGPGRWNWDGYSLSSTAFGTVRRQSSPPYAKDNPTLGALKDIDNLSVSMQFEDTGLRTKVRWKQK
ncbi:MAG: hypothetical protein O2923_05185 [Verrucomicrobia bacterium]|nr:hypothetical protein [Verrucomicrobiota bacterium]MDA1087108.1 hypothetical protein [Verrucomicrobiota bacterium]